MRRDLETPAHTDIVAEPALRTSELTKTYRGAAGDLTVLERVTLAVPKGAACAVVGPSGSGKTTLLGLCAGLDRPTSGEIWLAGRRLGELDEDGLAQLRRERVGFVFQNFQLIPTLTALENVLVPLELRGERGGAIEGRARDLLGEVGLGDRTGHYPQQLSGGEQQRVALARAFIGEPDVLFADEPTGNLDAASSEIVEEMLFRLNAARGTTLVIVTHDLELAGRVGTVFKMRGGRLEEGA